MGLAHLDETGGWSLIEMVTVRLKVMALGSPFRIRQATSPPKPEPKSRMMLGSGIGDVR